MNKKIFQEFNQAIKFYFFSDNVYEKKALLLSIQSMLEKNKVLSSKQNKFIFKKRKDTLLPLSLALFYSDRFLFDLFLKYTSNTILEQNQHQIIDSLFNSRFRTHPHEHRKIIRSEESSSYFFKALLNQSPSFFSSMKEESFLNIFLKHLYGGDLDFKIDFEFFKPHYTHIYQQLTDEKKCEYNIFYSLSNHAESVMYMIFTEKYHHLFSVFHDFDINIQDSLGNSVLMNAIHRNMGFAYQLVSRHVDNVNVSLFNQNNEDCLLLLCHKVNEHHLHTSYEELSYLLHYVINHSNAYLHYTDEQKEYIKISLDYAHTIFYEKERSLQLKETFCSLVEKAQLENHTHSETKRHKKNKL